MKHLRIVILVLLALLLPIRGAVAATMLCPEGEGTSETPVVAEYGHHDMHADHDMHVDHPAAHHHPSGNAAEEGTSSSDHPANCYFCAIGCCMASMVGTVPSLGQPGLTSSVTLPALSALVPAFHSGGLDRPPRTI